MMKMSLPKGRMNADTPQDNEESAQKQAKLHTNQVATNRSGGDAPVVKKEPSRRMQRSMSGDSIASTGSDIAPDGRTSFPDFEYLLNELEKENSKQLSAEGEDGKDNWLNMKKKYSTKEDEDVAVFLQIAERMSIESLLHLLQGHVREMNKSYNDLKKKEARKKRAVVKKFRWEEEWDNSVRVHVQEIEPIKEYKELWWNGEELDDVRSDLLNTIHFFTKYHPKYIQSLEALVKGEGNEFVLEEHMKKLTKDSFARGLETHMLKAFADRKKKIVKRVLNQQAHCKNRGDDYDREADCIRRQSLLHSDKLIGFAIRMGRCDEIEALKAKMSKWES